MAAEITKALIDAFVRYARLDEPDETELALISDILASDADYLAGAGVPDDSPQLRLVLFGMALHDYDHRDDAAAQQAYPPGVRLKIDQIKQRSFRYG